MDRGASSPEINSGRMNTGPGCGSMLVSPAAWDGLAADMNFTAASCQSVISDLTGAARLGPAAVAMTTDAAPYVAWLTTTREGNQDMRSDLKTGYPAPDRTPTAISAGSSSRA